MSKKLIILIATVVSFALTGASIAVAGGYSWPQTWYDAPTASQLSIKKFSEAPMLKVRVAAGELPPVEKRLPKDPLVLTNYKEQGIYGGTLRVARMGPSDWGDMHRGRKAFLFRSDPSTSKIIPYLAKGYSLSDDGKVLMIYLREGAKWSDGHPFTTDDIMWFYNYAMLDPDVRHWSVGQWTIDGKTAKFEKVDDYTLKITFPKPISRVRLTKLLNWWNLQQNVFYTPAHYMRKYHLRTNPNANELAKKEGFETWVQALLAHMTQEPSLAYPQPEMGPWVFTKLDAQHKLCTRNPYFWAVDENGNQLPYIDEVDLQFFSDLQGAILAAMQGKVDIAGRFLTTEEFPLYKENEKAGNYRVLTWQETKMAAVGFKFNLTSADPRKRPIFSDIRFRQAMSLAINRQAINEFVFLGLGTPQQYTIDSGASFYDPAWGRYMADYNPVKANSLLDEIGLKDVDNDGYREGLDGKPFIINVFVSSESLVGAIGFKVAQIVVDNWRDVGIKTNLKQISQELYVAKALANQLDVAVFPSEFDLESRVQDQFSRDNDGSGGAFGYAPLYQDWLDHQEWVRRGSIGEEPPKGEEPPESEKKLINLYNRYVNSVNPQEYEKLAKEFWEEMTHRLEVIGTVGKIPRPIIINNRVHNVPDVLPFSFETLLWVPATPAQWFIKE